MATYWKVAYLGSNRIVWDHVETVCVHGDLLAVRVTSQGSEHRPPVFTLEPMGLGYEPTQQKAIEYAIRDREQVIAKNSEEIAAIKREAKRTPPAG